MTLALSLICAAIMDVRSARADELLPDKSVGVRNRARPGYEPIGVKLGSYYLYPRASVGAAADDNIFATSSDEANDLITNLAASASLRSMGTRVPVALSASLDSHRYLDHPLENYVNWSSGGSLAYAIGARTHFDLNAETSTKHESRVDPSFPADVIERPAARNTGGMLKIAHDFASGTMALSGDYRFNDFEDARLPGGVNLDQDFRDRDVLTAELRSTFGIAHSVAALVRLLHTDQQYRQRVGAFDRDSRSDALYGGAAFEITNLMHGELGIGVIRVDNRDASQSDKTSLAFSGNIEFFVTQLVTLTLDLQRTSEAADLPGSASYIGTQVSLSVDYELRRNLIVAAKVLGSQRDYSNIDQSEERWNASLSARRLLNRRISIDLGYTYQERARTFLSSDDNYHDSVVALNVNLAL